jgi:hypothetical protein
MPALLLRSPASEDFPLLEPAGFEGDAGVLWFMGRPLRGTLPARLTLRLRGGHLPDVPDLPGSELNLPIVSEAVLEVLRPLGDVGETVPVAILDDWEATTVRTDFWVLNPLAVARGARVDAESAWAGPAWNPGLMLAFGRLQLDAARLPDAPVFVLHEGPGVFVLRDDAAEALERAALPGVAVAWLPDVAFPVTPARSRPDLEVVRARVAAAHDRVEAGDWPGAARDLRAMSIQTMLMVPDPAWPADLRRAFLEASAAVHAHQGRAKEARLTRGALLDVGG